MNFTMLERDYQAGLVKRIHRRFDPCHILKNDTSYQQGIPDLSLFIGTWWGWLEVKRKKPKPSDFEPNQEWFIDEAVRMSFGAVIYPENEEEVLFAIQRSLQSQRHARLIAESFDTSLDPVRRAEDGGSLLECEWGTPRHRSS